MHRNLPALAALLAMQAVALQAHAITSCAAGNPNTTTVAESTPTSAFVDHNDGTVTHGLTGLMWKRCAQGLSGTTCATGAATPMNWSAALASAVADTTAGRSDWRLPNKKELESIVEACGSNPAVNQTLFPATPASPFWSASSYLPAPANAWIVLFSLGYTSANPKGGNVFVRLVRGGKSLGLFDANLPLQTALDIDGNGQADALTDGLLTLRYLFGLRGTALIQGAVGAGAQRATAADIEAYLQAVVPK